jgi:RimJ/RimL family protein N-acetyltransferase
MTYRLREIELSDAEWIYRACQDAEIQRWTKVPRPYLVEHANSFVQDKNGEFGAWAIVHSLTNESVGLIGIHHVTHGVASVGYWVAPWGRNSGAASSALRIIPTFAFNLANAHTVQATIAESNTASRRTAERAGFSLLGESPETCPDNEQSVLGLTYTFTIHN